MPSDLDDLGDKLSQVRLASTEKLDPAPRSKPPPKPSSIFITKKFNSLTQNKKPLAPKNNISTPKKKVFDKNAFFSDSPMAVDDKRWGQKVNLYRSEAPRPPNVIHNPMEINKQIDPRAGVKLVSGFSKFSAQASPFKDPYSSLNNNTVKRAGEAFLDENAALFKDESKIAERLIQSISEMDDEKEIEKTLEEPIEDKDRRVKGLNVTLLDHQVHGLKFLRKREKRQVPRKGGLLCDDMGLGKTVQSIALIVKNKADEENLKDSADIEETESSTKVPKRKFKTTLVICPVSLGIQWQQEINRFAPSLKTLIFHGPSRTKDYKVLREYDVVISSYETIRSEHMKESTSPIYKGYWHRVILDEAHTIKNPKAKASIAVCAIESLRRWCLTGTPIQNSIDELQSLFMFLRISNLSDPNVWKTAISKLIKNNKSVDAFRLLKKELEVVMLRRTKAILKNTNFRLPEKKIHSTEIIFSEPEQVLYDNLKRGFVSKLTDKLDETNEIEQKQSNSSRRDLSKHISETKVGTKNDSNKTGEKSFYMSALLSLLRLRQVCCHWKLLADEGARSNTEEVNPGPVKKVDSSSTLSSNSSVGIDQDLDDLADFMTALTVKETKCEICFENKVSGSQKVCTGCVDKMNTIKQSESAKVLKLIEILSKDRERKTIVFSQFRELLVLLGPVLETMGFNYVMYDGQMNVKQKDKALEELRNNKETTILLCSLRSGALGLNLTVASQVVLYDPWWNPQIEEQAVDRVYRIGQTKEVDVHRFCVKGSVEEGIMKLQEKKRKLAKAVTDGDSDSRAEMSKLTSSDLMRLFGLHKS